MVGPRAILPATPKRERMEAMRCVSKILLSAAVVAGLATTGQAQVKLVPKFEEGTAVTQETNSKTHQILTINGQEVETDSEESTTSTRTIGQRQTDGTLPIAIKVEAVKINLNLPGGINFQYDSTAPAPKDADERLAFLTDIFKAIAGSSYTVAVDKEGKAVSVEGLDKLLQKAEELNPQAGAMLKSRLDVERIKAQVGEERARYPEILVREGESWNRTESQALGGGQTLTFEKTYEYLGTVEKEGKALDKIGVKVTGVTYTMDADSPSPLKVEKSDLKIDSSEGTILFDREAGRAIEETLLTRIKGDMTMSIMGQQLPATLDLTLDTTETTRPK